MAVFKSKNPIAKGVGLLVIGLILILVFLKDFILSFDKPTAVADMTTAELTDGVLVEDDIFAVLDYFMYEEKINSKYTNKLSSYVSSYYYIIPVLTKDSEELYMALELSATSEDKINSICKDTISYLYGEMSEDKYGYNTYHVTGPVRAMSEEEIQYMVQWFQRTDYFGTRDESVIRSYIYPVMIEQYNPVASRILTALGVFATLIGIIYIITGTISRTQQVKISNNKPTYTPTNNYTPYQTGFIQTAAPDTPENTDLQSGFLNQQNKGYLNQQKNTTPNPSQIPVTTSAVNSPEPPEKPVSENIPPSKPTDTNRKASSGLSDIFFKVDHK